MPAHAYGVAVVQAALRSTREPKIQGKPHEAHNGGRQQPRCKQTRYRAVEGPGGFLVEVVVATGACPLAKAERLESAIAGRSLRAKRAVKGRKSPARFASDEGGAHAEAARVAPPV